jgi:DNA-directed RNA polymerase sigma subunit (sigma70/sigma32)
MLGAQEECIYMLARRGGGDREAAHALVTSHLRLVESADFAPTERRERRDARRG